ncbi:NAD-dependent epimerase/dehydratase family protein, partial [Desulfovibrio sp. OttesenSCG-928-G15]|nr:NAD-dependent epimerase/dehydratase family protein [Desulfovibrio sp. OttesenSCG-928-G15]
MPDTQPQSVADSSPVPEANMPHTEAGASLTAQSASDEAQSASGGGAHAVTGAFGFTGKYLAQRLLNSGKRVLTLTASPQRPNPFGDAVEARTFDFSRAEAMVEA